MGHYYRAKYAVIEISGFSDLEFLILEMAIPERISRLCEGISRSQFMDFPFIGIDLRTLQFGLTLSAHLCVLGIELICQFPICLICLIAFPFLIRPLLGANRIMGNLFGHLKNGFSKWSLPHIQYWKCCTPSIARFLRIRRPSLQHGNSRSNDN